MYFHKISHPFNFVFADRFDKKKSAYIVGKRTLSTKLDSFGNDVFRLTVNDKKWKNRSLAGLTPTKADASADRYSMTIGSDGAMAITERNGTALFSGLPGATFGLCGSSRSEERRGGQEPRWR